MGVGVALNVEREGIGENVLVVVGRAVEQSHSLALLDPRASDLGIPARGALERVDGTCPADDFIRCRCGTDPLVQLPLFWMVQQSQHGVTTTPCVSYLTSCKVTWAPTTNDWDARLDQRSPAHAFRPQRSQRDHHRRNPR